MNFSTVFRKCSACSASQKAAQSNKNGCVPLVPLVPWQRARARRRNKSCKLNNHILSRVHFFAEHAEQAEHYRPHLGLRILTKRNKRNTCGTLQMTEKPKPMREAMPEIAEWIDELRAAFGKESIDSSIRAGMAGIPGFFYVKQGDIELGTPWPAPTKFISIGDMVIRTKAERAQIEAERSKGRK